jgi:hypothetical protein
MIEYKPNKMKGCDWSCHCNVLVGMKRFFQRLSLAAAITFIVMLVPSRTYSWQTDSNATTAVQSASDGQIPASGHITTQDAKPYSGRVVNENGDTVLQDPVTKVEFKLSDAAMAKPYIGKLVKVTGKLDTNSNTILMERIEPAS